MSQLRIFLNSLMLVFLAVYLLTLFALQVVYPMTASRKRSA